MIGSSLVVVIAGGVGKEFQLSPFIVHQKDHTEAPQGKHKQKGPFILVVLIVEIVAIVAVLLILF